MPERMAFHWMTGDKDSHPVMSESILKLDSFSMNSPHKGLTASRMELEF
jgi:hypothetical protein